MPLDTERCDADHAILCSTTQRTGQEYEKLITQLREISMQTPVENHFEKCTLAAPDRILVATDLTDTDFLVPYAVAQAKACGAQVTIAHALPPSDLVPIDGAAIPYVDRTKIIRDVRVTLLSVARLFEAQGISCDTFVKEGIAREVIPEELNRVEATRLIMGSHGRGKLKQLTLGSVARDLIAETNIPVFVVGPRAHTDIQHVTPRRILHPLSLMGDYRKSLQLAFDIAQSHRAELILLHVLDQDLNPSMNPEKTVEWANNALKALVPDGTKLVPPVHTKVTSGKLVEQILKVADQTDSDWIVLGADGSIRVWPFNEGVAYKVLCAASCPVLTLRHEPARIPIAADLAQVHFTTPL